MDAVGLAHVALPVADMDVSRHFYEDVLGLTADPARPDFGFPGAWYKLGAHQVHLMELGPVTPDRRQHFAVAVTDLDAAVATVEAAGWEISRSPHFPGAGYQAFLSDPDGHQIEFNQPD